MKAFLKRLKMELAVSRTPCAVRSGLTQGKQKLFQAPVFTVHFQAGRSPMSISQQQCLCSASEVRCCLPSGKVRSKELPIAVFRQHTASTGASCASQSFGLGSFGIRSSETMYRVYAFTSVKLK